MGWVPPRMRSNSNSAALRPSSTASYVTIDTGGWFGVCLLTTLSVRSSASTSR
jgi:hypothetical protein